MKKLFFVIGLTIAINYFIPSVAYSFNVETRSDGGAIKWEDNAATFLVNTTDGPSFALSAIQAAMANWTNAGADFAYSYGGSTTSTKSNDGQNTVFFGDPSGSLIGEATYFYDSSGFITDCDIEIDESFSWTETYLEDLATHEFGHCLPLGHESGSVTMNATVSAGARNLAQDDIDGIIAIYGAYTGIPTMNEWGMIIFTIFAGGLAVRHLRKEARLQFR